MRTSRATILALSLVVTSCGGGESASSEKTAAVGTLCGPRYDLVEPGSSCPGGLCLGGVVSGSATAIGTMSFSASDRMCTRACNASGDCGGISFTTANRVAVQTESWACVATNGGKYCAVGVVAPTGGGQPCSICGGAFCSGDCIGCPQCR